MFKSSTPLDINLHTAVVSEYGRRNRRAGAPYSKLVPGACPELHMFVDDDVTLLVVLEHATPPWVYDPEEECDWPRILSDATIMDRRTGDMRVVPLDRLAEDPVAVRMLGPRLTD